MKRETVIKHVHLCGSTCETRGKTLFCPACDMPVIDPSMMIRLDTYTEPEPPEAA